MIDWASKTAEKVTMSREGLPQSKLLHDELTLKVKLGPNGAARFSKNTKKEEDEGEYIEIREPGPGAGVAEETNRLNAERQKKSISTFSDLYFSTISVLTRRDNDTSADLQVLFVPTLSIHVCSFIDWYYRRMWRSRGNRCPQPSQHRKLESVGFGQSWS